MAPPGVPQAEDPGAPDGVPRDHQVGHRRRRRQPPRHRLRPRRRRRDPPPARPAVRLRGVARPVATGESWAVGGAGAEPVDPPDRRARARADRLRRGGLLGHRPADRDLAVVRGDAGDRGRHEGGRRSRLRHRRAHPRQRHRPRRGPCPLADGCAGTGGVHRRRGRHEAVPQQPTGSVHDLDAAAGGRPQAAPVLLAGDAPRPGAVRARLHHLHAHRQRHAQRRGAGGDPRRGAAGLRAAVPVARAAAVRHQGEERPGGPRGDPSDGRRCAHPTPSPAS